MTQPVYFALIADRRSGSTMLNATLNQHPQIDLSGEIFNSFAAVDGQHYGETGYGATLATYWNWRRTEHKPTATAIGTLIHRYHAELFPGLWELTRGLHTRFICIYRDNILRQLVSEMIAMNSWQWTARTGPVEELPKVTVDPQTLREYVFQRYRERTADWLFQPRIECSLEHMTSNWKETMERLQAYLAVPLLSIEPALPRQETRKLSDIVINYDEVAETVKSLGREEWLVDGVAS